MIKLKLSTMENEGSTQIPIIPGEGLDSAVDRILEKVPLDKTPKEVFQVLVNGMRIEEDMWSVVILKEQDSVLVCPKIRGDDPSSVFRSVFVVVATVVASYFLTPAGGATLFSALSVAGVSIGATLLIYALIPPSVEGLGGIGGSGGMDDSQMYSINGQSNQTRRYNTVPKVYGTHLMFPTIAANPYTEIETDPATGELVQYLYAIYDFGLGPTFVGDIFIGDSPLTNFTDYEFNLVDPNKPSVNEGPWDLQTRNNFQIYKGDVSIDQSGIVLDGDRQDGDVLSTYQAIRNSASNPDGSPQEITLSFVNPRGLYAYSATGARSTRTIELEIFFKGPDGIEHAYNDVNYVSSFSAKGGAIGSTTTSLIPTLNAYWQYSTSPIGGPTDIIPATPLRTDIDNDTDGQYRAITMRTRYFGVRPGDQVLYLSYSSNVAVGDTIEIGNRVLGYVDSIYIYPGNQYAAYTLRAPITGTSAILLSVREKWEGWILPYNGYANYSVFDSAPYAPIFSRKINLGQAIITRDSQAPTFSTFKFTPRQTGQFSIRVDRVRTYSTYTTQVEDSLSLAEVRTRFDRNPIVTDKRHTFMELKIKATNQLNGVIQNLSAVCSSALEVYDPDTQTWSRQLTSNPAWVFTDLLIGEVNKRRIDKSKLHVDSLVEWAQFCADMPQFPVGGSYVFVRFLTNFILDYNVTLQGVLQQVAGSAQASLNVIDGKYGVLLDVRRNVPVQIFTPRNSKNFSSTRIYSKKPHALKITFVDPSMDWKPSETIVYDDGYDETTATEFDELTSFAVTNQEQAWRFGRYMMAQNRLRQETMSLTVDFEHLVCTRGDFVQITQDTMKVGGSPARVKTISGTIITIDDGLDLPAVPLGYVYRSSNGDIKNNTLTAIDAETFDLDGDIPSVGDLIVIGETSKVVFDCLIKSITPNDDMSATLVLVEKADAVYDAEYLAVLPPYDPQISQTTDVNAPPGPVQSLTITDNFYECLGFGYQYYIDVDWDSPSGSTFEVFQVFVDYGRGYNIAATTRSSLYKYIVEPGNLGVVHNFKVLAVSSTGNKLDLGAVSSVSATPARKTAAPSDVTFLASDITDQVLQLSWQRINDCDASEYLIRFSPNRFATWESTIPLLRVDRNTSLISTQARSGIYLIKAVDFNGNESANAAAAITTIPELTGLNVISSVTDFPALPGTKDMVQSVGGTLVLEKRVIGGVDTGEYYSEGYYYYNDLLDLGEIYTVRLQSLIQAEGYTEQDVIANWVTLDSVLLMANARTSEWDVEAQYRSTEELNVMSEWANLADIDPIGGGSADAFTPWRKFVIGDATGRIFQFRLKLISNKVSVSPRVFDGTIKADMPDRTESYNNLIATAADGYNLQYTPAFKGPGTTPNVQVSIDGASSGDYWAFDYRGLDGLVIRFFDKDNNPVTRQFDLVARGYGRQATSAI